METEENSRFSCGVILRTCEVVLAAESLAAKASGIGRVARLMERVFSERYPAQGKCVGVSLSDASPPADAVFDVLPCKGNRFRFVIEVQRKGFRAQRVAYDSLSMARAHSMGPARFRPALAWMHGIEVWEHARNVHLQIAKCVDLLVTNSEYTLRRASALHPELKRAKVCWLGTETDRPAEPMTDHWHPPTAMILSRIDDRSYKGHDALVEIWPSILERVPDARLLVAGSGPGVQELQKRALNLRQIEFSGYVQESAIPALWNETDVFVMPSQGEGFGLVYIEAMRHGKPVIASCQDAGQEINIHGATGYNVDLNRPSDLVDVLVRLLVDHGQARAMGRAGQERWQRFFSWSAFRARFVNLIDQEGF